MDTGGGGVLQECWGRGVCRAPQEELRPGVGSQVADQAKLHPPPGGCRTGREPSSKGMNSGGGWGLPWPQVPPPCLSKEGIEGPPVLTTSLLAPVPRKAGWGASSVSRHSFLGAGCSFPGQHSAVMELGGQVWRRTAGEMGSPDSDLDPGAPLRGFSGTALTARAARLGAELHGHAALPLSPVAAWALGVTARSDPLPRTVRSLASTRSRSQLASPLPSPLTASRASSQSSRTRLAKVRSPHVGSGTLSQG